MVITKNGGGRIVSYSSDEHVKKSCTIVKTKHGNCEELDIKVGVHHSFVLSQLQFIIVLEALKSKKKGKSSLGTIMMT